MTNNKQIQISSFNINSQKDSFVYAFHPENSGFTKLGKIFVLIEIKDTSLIKNIEILEQVLRKFENFYYNYEHQAVYSEDHFENSLKFLNQKINELIETDQLYTKANEFNILTGLIINKNNNFELHLSPYGKEFEAFLIHKMKFNNYHIINVLDDKDNSLENFPLKIFSNVITGEISNNDSLIVCNSNVYNYLAEDIIIRNISNNSPVQAVETFTNNLQTIREKNFIGLVIKFSEIYEKEKKENYFSTTPISTTTPIPVHKPINSSSKYSLDRLISTEDVTKKILSSNINLNIKNNFTKFKNKISQQISQFKKSQNNNSKDKLKKYNKSNIDLSSYLTNIIKTIKSFWKSLSKISFKIFKKLYKLFLKLPQKSKLFLLGACLLIAIFYFSTVSITKKQAYQEKETEYKNITKQIIDKKNRAETRIIYKEEEEAKILFKEIDNLILTLPKEVTETETFITEINSEISLLKQKIQRIISVSDYKTIANITSLDEKITLQDFIIENDTIFTFDDKNNKIYKVSKQNGEILKKDIGTTLFKNIIKNPNDGNLFLMDNDSNVFKYDINNDTISDLSMDITNVSDIIIYNKYLYALDNTNNQIYKYSPNSSTFNNKIPWLKDTTINIKNAHSLAIDGEIYVLTSANNIYKFSRGNRSDNQLTLETLDPPISNLKQIYTTEKTDYIYLLEKDRVIVYNKEGKLVNQYKNTKLQEMEDWVIDEENSIIYVINGSEIGEFTLEHL